MFSLAPVLIIAIALAGLVFGEDAARGRIVEQMSGLIGSEGARAIEVMIQQAGQREGAGLTATLVGFATLLLGATGVFAELQDSLNTVWRVSPARGQGLLRLVRDRFLSFAMVLGIAFLLLVSMVLSAMVAAMGRMGDTGLGEGTLHALEFSGSSPTRPSPGATCGSAPR